MMQPAGSGGPHWQCVATEPGAAAAPDEVDWSDAVPLELGQLIGAIAPAADVDSHDWWLRLRTSAGHLHLDALSFLGEVFVDGRLAVTSASSFLPLDLPLPGVDCELAIALRSLESWLGTRRPRGRWRSSMTSAQGMRFARVSLIGRVPAYDGPPPQVGASGVRLGEVPLLSGVQAVAVLGESGTPGQVRVRAEASRPAQLTVSVTGPRGEVTEQQVAITGEALDAVVEVDDPELWWPAGYGEAHCYEVRILEGVRVLASRVVGFRRVTVDDESGGFVLAVNGVRVFARGAVLIGPVDDAVIDRLAAAGATMVRFAGGTTPASDAMWERCARRGVLVWHEAMLATFDTPDELDATVCDEMRQLLRRHGGNPALAVLCGGSETMQQPEMMGLEPHRRTQPLIEELLPGAVAEWASAAGVEAPVYLPSSPSAGGGRSVLRPGAGVSHWFGVGGYRQPLTSVRSAGVRFASEALAFAVPGDVTPDALPDVAAGSESWKAGVPRDRGASWDFEDVRDHYVGEIFGVEPTVLRTDDPARYLELGRAAVAEAMQTCFDQWRRADDPCAGGLVLAAADLRAGAGWGLLDHDLVPKAPLLALRRSWSPVAVAAGDDGLAGVRIDVHNDTRERIEARVELRASDGRGHVTVEGALAVDLPAHGSIMLWDSDVTGRFSDLAYAYRFGERIADAVDVRLVADSGSVLARTALVLNARTPEAPSSACLHAELDGDGLLLLRSDTALRWVHVDLPGREAADDWFHLAAGVEYVVPTRVTAAMSRAEGWVRSVDLPRPVRVTAAGGTPPADPR